MTPRRHSGTYPVANRRVVAWMLLLIGLAAAAFGLGIAGVELWHAVRERHPAIWSNVAAAALFFGSGVALIQTGSVRETLAILSDALPLFASRRVGGRRATDPDDADNDDEADADDGDATTHTPGRTP